MQFGVWYAIMWTISECERIWIVASYGCSLKSVTVLHYNLKTLKPIGLIHDTICYLKIIKILGVLKFQVVVTVWNEGHIKIVTSFSLNQRCIKPRNVPSKN